LRVNAHQARELRCARQAAARSFFAPWPHAIGSAASRCARRRVLCRGCRARAL